MRPVRTLTAAAATALTLGLAACSSGAEDTVTEEPPATVSADPAEEETEPAEEETEPAEDDTEGDAASSGETPEWADPYEVTGEQISTFDVGDVRVDVYQVGTEEATDTGFFVDPESNEPVIDVGDEIVYVNYVVTNEGDPVDLGSSLVSFDTRYDDWPYMQGMDGVTDSEQMESLGLADDVPHYAEPSVYTLGTDQSYATAENFLYQSGSPLTIQATITPVDAEGELLHDERMEAEGTGTIS
ncbi:hypothetical protein [Cellulosimicrobium arenosum]|uniref:DUF4352 domain-containing protein n=1 Tax=Cellulosimicrobium arenosum TaxID=2708133 RepID=A0A927J2A3_9MICO|nr:hypothetical protein [Cellulosimicrobium arenosum]MBD8080305.1 hypothetical protein [Cellulosimicrobium arenosum]